MVIGGEEEEGETIMSMSLSRLGVKAKLCDSSAISKYLKTLLVKWLFAYNVVLIQNDCISAVSYPVMCL